MSEITSGAESFDDYIEIGPKSTHKVSLSLINEIEQIRKNYPDDQIRDLASSIEIVNEYDGEVQFDMYNPLLCAYLTKDETDQYMHEHALFYDTNTVGNDNLLPDENGNYTILIAGHRRKRAIEFLLEKHCISKDSVSVHANQRAGITFEEGLMAQIRENTYEKVPPEEMAKHIERYYVYLSEYSDDRPPTIARIAASTGLGESTVSSALKFMRLPNEIREVLKSPHNLISYTTLVRLEPLQRALQAYHKHEKISETLEDYVRNSLFIMINTLLESGLKGEAGHQKLIRAKIESLKSQIDFDQDTFFVMQPENSVVLSKRSSTQLAKTALAVFRYAKDSGADLSRLDFTGLEE